MLMSNKDVGAFTKSNTRDQIKPVEEVFPFPEEDPTMSIFKKSFKDAIEFKVFTNDACPNVVLFERILQKITKICQHHPHELMQTSDSEKGTWVLILNSLFKFA